MQGSIDIQKIISKVTEQESFSIVREEASKIFKNNDAEQCWQYAMEFYKSEYFQVQEIAVFLLGYISCESEKALEFLKETVSKSADWRVQEILAMAFDCYCKSIGYEKSLPIIEEWLISEHANVRRAATEGLRIWTSKPFLKDNPQRAITILSNLKSDKSEYVRKSVGNSLKDISKKHPDLIKNELDTWDLSSKEVLKVHKLASKFIFFK
jgi:3-methyladenine DNA glycosylase AlkD